MPTPTRIIKDSFIRLHPAWIFKETLIRLYLSPAIRKAASFVCPLRQPEKWIFIVGCYNSGTTILRELLSAHPQFSTLPREGVRFTSILARPESLGWTRMWSECEEYVSMPPVKEPQKALQIQQDWSPWWKLGSDTFVEKSIANIARMEWLDLNFENVYFVGIVRNGYCSAAGIRKKAKPSGDVLKRYGKQYPVEMAGRQWNLANERLMENGKKVQRFHLIRYEDLAKAPLETLEEIWRFFEADFPAMEQKGKSIQVGNKRFTIKDMNALSLQRLSSEDKQRLNKVIAPMMERFGYELIKEKFSEET